MTSGVFDYVIVGAGAAGCVAANRLSENPRVSVLLVESGGPDRNPLLLVPKANYFTTSNSRYIQQYQTVGRAGMPSERWIRGHLVGGSTSINGMMWNRGWTPDLEAVGVALDGRGGAESFLAAYRALEDHQLGASPLRGVGGPIPISVSSPPDEVSEAFASAAQGSGLTRVSDWNGSDLERVAYVPSTIRNGLRVSASRGLLRPIRSRINLHIQLRATVGQLEWDGTRVVGLSYRQDGALHTVRARRAVVVAAGALETPALLERSGIGRPEVLRAAGVVPRVESPNVGENLREHRGVSFQFALNAQLGFNRLLSSPLRQAWTGARYLLSRDGVISFGAYNVIAGLRADPQSPRPDTQVFFTPLSTTAPSMSADRKGKRLRVSRSPGLMLLAYPLRPQSVGSVHIAGPERRGGLDLVPNFLDHPADRALLALGVRRVRHILANSPMGDLLAGELLPGADIAGEDDIVRLARSAGTTGYHASGTCAVGTRDDAVLDSRLRVRGVEGLRVFDASAFPFMPSGNNNAPTYALSWIGSELLAADGG